MIPQVLWGVPFAILMLLHESVFSRRPEMPRGQVLLLQLLQVGSFALQLSLGYTRCHNLPLSHNLMPHLLEFPRDLIVLLLLNSLSLALFPRLCWMMRVSIVCLSASEVAVSRLRLFLRVVITL